MAFACPISAADIEWPTLVAATTGPRDARSAQSIVMKLMAVDSSGRQCPGLSVAARSDHAEETTDAGSCTSEGESSCSSVGLADDGLARRKPSLLRRPGTLRGRSEFVGSPLETIPGTPVARAAERERLPLEVPLSCPPTSPKRRREATLARARREGVPLKARMPDYCVHFRPLDPMLPAKKRPPFPELAGLTGNALNLRPDMPAKKNVTKFLLQDFPTFCAIPHVPPSPR